MPSIILPGRWLTQPQGAVEVDHKYGANFVWSASSDRSIVTPAGQLDGVLTNTSGWVETATPRGVARVAGQNGLQIAGSFGVYSSDVSFLVVGNAPANNTWNICALTPFGAFRRYFGNYSIHLATGGPKYIAAATQWDTTGNQSVVIARTALDGSARGFWVDGVPRIALATGNSDAYSPASFNILQGASGDRSSSTYWAASTSLIAAFDRLLTDAEVNELSANPWQIFKPRRRILYFDVTSGGASTNLVIAAATHSHTADGLALTLDSTLAIAESTHAHAADVLDLTSLTVLSVADALHAHLADSIALDATGSETLTIAESAHAHSADAPALTTDSMLAIVDAVHAHLSDGVVLTSEHVLAVADAIHAHLADAPTLSVEPSLAIAEASHGHSADALALTSDSMLAIADSVHAHLADNVSLTFAETLAILEALHAHYADILDLDVLSLTAEDLAAIADAVWASAEAVSAHAKLDAILARLTC